MKKTILSMAFALAVTGVFAQETGGMTSKKGEAILPEANDWALSIDAAPVMNYLGRFLSGTGGTSPTWGYPGTPLAVTGKMFKDEKTAYRAMIRLGFGTTNTNTYLASVATPSLTVSDSRKVSHNNIVIGGGMEWRRGKTRLQGFYGGMLMFGMGGSDTTNTYGNPLSATYTGPRVTENKAGGSIMLALRGFIGAEYFIFPKMSVGAEFGWGLGLTSTGEGEKTTEAWDSTGTPAGVKTTVTNTGKSSSFGLDTDVNGTQLVPTGALTLTMHF